MISLFTTAKDFEGATAVRQLNALRSWQAAPVEVEVFVCGDARGLRPVIRQLGLIHIPDIDTSAQGVPLVNSMFETVQRRSRFEICCFVNADILLPHHFFTNAIAIHEHVQRDYLLAGQRYDVDVETSLEFHGDWLPSFRQQHGSCFDEHPPTGSDYFLFPTGQYHVGEIPDLIVGRWGWDLWMIYQARQRKLRMIDLSPATKVIHQNHGYAHKKNGASLEDEHNLTYLPEAGKYLFHLLACDFRYEHGQLVENVARGDARHYWKVERLLGRSAWPGLLRHWSTTASQWVSSKRAG